MTSEVDIPPPRHPVPDWRPLVTLNAAMSLDGRIAAQGGRTLVLSDEEDLRRVHRLRAGHDAILVGIGTVLADDPALVIKRDLCAEGDDPVRVVLDSRHRTPAAARIASGSPPTILYCADPEVKRVEVLKSLHGLDVVVCPPNEEGLVSLDAALQDLRRRGIRSVLVEGGSRVIASFLREHLVDRLSLFVAPVLIGEGAPSLVADPARLGAPWLHSFDVTSCAGRPTGVTVQFVPRDAPR